MVSINDLHHSSMYFDSTPLIGLYDICNTINNSESMETDENTDFSVEHISNDSKMSSCCG